MISSSRSGAATAEDLTGPQQELALALGEVFLADARKLFQNGVHLRFQMLVRGRGGDRLLDSFFRAVNRLGRSGRRAANFAARSFFLGLFVDVQTQSRPEQPAPPALHLSLPIVLRPYFRQPILQANVQAIISAGEQSTA